MSNETKRCRVCAELYAKGDDVRSPMCGACRYGLACDIERVKAIPRRLVRAVKAFWAAAVQP